MYRILLMGIGALLHLATWGQVSVYDCQPSSVITQQNEVYNPSPYFRRCMEFEATQSYQYGVGSIFPNRDLHLSAEKSITIDPKFQAQYSPTSSGSGSLLLEVTGAAKSPFEVAVMNYDHLEAVRRYDRLELGIQLPDSINTKIKEFLNPGTTGQTQQLNPYMSWDIQVTAEFFPLYSPSDVTVMQGFHYVPFTRDEPPLPAPMDGFNNVLGTNLLPLLGGWTKQSTDFPFRIRFAPPTLGKWGCRVKVQSGQVNLTSTSFEFNVVQSSRKPYLQIGAAKRFFYHNGQNFTPIGNNLIWPRTTQYWDKGLAQLYGYSNATDCSNNDCIGPDESYKLFTPPVRTFRIFREQIEHLANSGGNIFRMLMAPQSIEIEFEKLGNYYDRQNIAYELDDILYTAEKKDILIYWNLQLHDAYQTNNYSKRFWDWEDNNTGVAAWDVIESGNCYKSSVNHDTIPNVLTPYDFFNSADAKRFYKERLRYILARWGYSTGIGAFELFSEINQAGLIYETNQSTGKLEAINCPYSNKPEHNNASVASACAGLTENDPMFITNQQTVYNWQKEMIDYMKDELKYNRHLYAVSYAGPKGKHDDSYDIKNVDINTYNNYDARVRTGDFDFYDQAITKQDLADDGGFEEAHDKPLFYSETGSFVCDRSVEMVRGQWKLLFSGTGGFSWASGYKQSPDYKTFKSMSQFISGVNINGERWHPGQVQPNIVAGGLEDWKFKSNWSDHMKKDNSDLTYLRRGDGRRAIGVITNRTYNYYTQSPVDTDGVATVFHCNDDQNNDAKVPTAPNHYVQTVSNNSLKKRLKLRHMHSKQYKIDYFWAHDPNTIIYSSYDHGPKVKLEHPNLPATENGYILLFKAYPKKDGEFKSAKKTKAMQPTEWQDETVASEPLLLYPNPNTGSFKLALSNPEDGRVLVKIFDLHGKVIYDQSFPHLKQLDLNLPQAKPGIHLIQVTTDSNQYIKKVLIH